MTQETYYQEQLAKGVSIADISKAWSALKKEQLDNAPYRAYVDSYEMAGNNGKTKKGKCIFIAQFGDDNKPLGNNIIGFGRRKAMALSKCENLSEIITQFLATDVE